MRSDPSYRKFLEVMGVSPGEKPCSADAVWETLRLWVAFARTQASIEAREQFTLTGKNLTRGEFAVLDALYFKGRLLLGDIRRKILVSNSGITYLVDRLEKRGLVERTPSSEDRRAVYAELTPEGTRYFQKLFPDHANGLCELFSEFSPEEQETLSRLIQRLGKNADDLLRKETNERGRSGEKAPKRTPRTTEKR